MRKKVLSSPLCICLCVLAGCAVLPVRRDSTALLRGIESRLIDTGEQTIETLPPRPFDFREIMLDNGL